jgi:glycine/D-amino acid oxidase-like deaminating enzyme
VDTPSGALTADVIVHAAGACADVVADRAGVASLKLRVLNGTARLVPEPPEVASWPFVMGAGGRCYFEPGCRLRPRIAWACSSAPSLRATPVAVSVPVLLNFLVRPDRR